MSAATPAAAPVMAYISRCRCGGITFACVDLPEYKKDTATEIAGLIREGRSVERVAIEVAQTTKWCTDSRAHRSAHASEFA